MLPPNSNPCKPTKFMDVYKLAKKIFGEKWKVSEELKYYQEACDPPPMNLDFIREENEYISVDEDLRV